MAFDITRSTRYGFGLRVGSWFASFRTAAPAGAITCLDRLCQRCKKLNVGTYRPTAGTTRLADDLCRSNSVEKLAVCSGIALQHLSPLSSGVNIGDLAHGHRHVSIFSPPQEGYTPFCSFKVQGRTRSGSALLSSLSRRLYLVAVSDFACSLRTSALSVASQVKFSPVRPKWP